jgi:pyruvate/2-oxoglutarate dehydrogenase complex dihydrolipoamide acyltransferase (E2) component
MFARNRAKPPRQPACRSRCQATDLSPARVTARSQQSKQTIPHFCSTQRQRRVMPRSQAALPEKPAWDAFFVRAVAVALQQYDRFGYRFESDALIPQMADSVGVAVDVADDLRVVYISGAATKTIAEISAEIRAAAEKLRRGEPLPQAAQSGGAITITNLGSTGVAIINRPRPPSHAPSPRNWCP